MRSSTLMLKLLLAAWAATALCSSHEGYTRSSRKLLQQSENADVQPRLSMSEIDAMDDTEPYKVMMLLAWQQLTTSPRTNSPFSFWQLAGVHGKSWAYNGVNPPSTGFCRHQVPGFGPWHRAYMRQFELALIQAARTAAAAFQDDELRAQYAQVAETIRLPYWDWTDPVVPELMTARSVNVLDRETGEPTTIRNPFGPYQYTAAAGDGRNAGRRVIRGSNWAQAASQSARRFGQEMASLLRSNTWRCTYLTGVGCTGNLESTHNEIHNILGGTQGEMATVIYAGFDPLFWLHHCMVDRVLWLFQNNGGQWMGASSYSPFLNLEGDAADIASYGYSYSTGRPIGRGGSNNNGGRSNRVRGGGRRSRGDAAWLSSADAPQAALAAAATLGSPESRAAVRATIKQWTGNYMGYTWAVRFFDIEQHHHDHGAVHLLVYLRAPGSNATTTTPTLPTGTMQALTHDHASGLPKDHTGHHNHAHHDHQEAEVPDSLGSNTDTAVPPVQDLNELRLRPGYCGSVAGFNEHVHVHSEAGDTSISRAVDLTHCLRQAGLDPNVAPNDPENPSHGPAASPLRLSDLQVVAVTADGQDVSAHHNYGKAVISWSVQVARTVAQVRAVSGGDPTELQAFAHPLAWGAEQTVMSMVVGDALDS